MYFVIEKPGRKEIAFIFLLIVYSLFGAFVMMAFEQSSDSEMKQIRYEREMKIFDQSRIFKEKLDQLVIKATNNLQLVDDDIKLLQWCRAKANMSKPQLKDTVWNPWEALFFVSSLYTTIGYGNNFPTTVGGRCFTMIYAIMGIPLVILILDNWGKLLFRLVCLMWNKIARRSTQSNSCLAGCCRKTEIESLAEGQDVIDINNVPLLLALFICIGYICFCSAIYLIWEEDWNYFTSFYFFFISLTTVGLGDVLPKHVEYSVCASVLILFGLAVVSMCINVIQVKLDNIFNDVARAIDRKYKQRLLTMDESNETEDRKDGIKNLENEQDWQKKLLMKMMNDEKKKLLEEKMEHMSKLRNRGMQAVTKTAELNTQTINDCEEAETQTSTKTKEGSTQTGEGRNKNKEKKEITTHTNEETSSDSDPDLPIYRWDMMNIV